MTFSEQPRHQDGKFGEKVGASPDVALTPLEPKLEEYRLEDDVAHPGNHPRHAGLKWGITRSSYWGDYSVDTGYFGLQTSQFTADEPQPWTADAATFEQAAIVWQHRDDITAALKGAGITDRYRLRIDVDENNFTISEYDWQKFEGIVVPRRD